MGPGVPHLEGTVEAVKVSAIPADLLPGVRGRLLGPQGPVWLPPDLETVGVKASWKAPQPQQGWGGLKQGTDEFLQIKAGSPAFDSQTSSLLGG